METAAALHRLHALQLLLLLLTLLVGFHNTGNLERR